MGLRAGHGSGRDGDGVVTAATVERHRHAAARQRRRLTFGAIFRRRRPEPDVQDFADGLDMTEAIAAVPEDPAAEAVFAGSQDARMQLPAHPYPETAPGRPVFIAATKAVAREALDGLRAMDTEAGPADRPAPEQGTAEAWHGITALDIPPVMDRPFVEPGGTLERPDGESVYLRAVAPDGTVCREESLTGEPEFAGFRTTADGRTVAGLGLGACAAGVIFLDEGSVARLDMLIAAATAARDALAYSAFRRNQEADAAGPAAATEENGTGDEAAEPAPAAEIEAEPTTVDGGGA
jgi:hypothetical protein